MPPDFFTYDRIQFSGINGGLAGDMDVMDAKRPGRLREYGTADEDYQEQ